jgi:hypothetical protein
VCSSITPCLHETAKIGPFHYLLYDLKLGHFSTSPSNSLKTMPFFQNEQRKIFTFNLTEVFIVVVELPFTSDKTIDISLLQKDDWVKLPPSKQCGQLMFIPKQPKVCWHTLSMHPFNKKKVTGYQSHLCSAQTIDILVLQNDDWLPPSKKTKWSADVYPKAVEIFADTPYHPTHSARKRGQALIINNVMSKL